MSDHIPEDIQRLILDKLSSPRDHARSSVVCKMWYSIYKKRTFPWFVLSDHDEGNHTRGFFSLYDQKIYRLSAPELERKYIFGSSHGWLVTVDKKLAICLYEPFSKVRIRLPRIPKEDKNFSNVCRRMLYDIVVKIVLSCDPRTNPEGCVILCVWGFALTYCRVGDKKWTIFPEPSGMRFCAVHDVVFHKGNFLLFWRTKVFIFHLASGSESEPRITVLMLFCPEPDMPPFHAYLASVGGNLFVVSKGYNLCYLPEALRIFEENGASYVPVSQVHFDAYKFDEENMTGWSKENDIGGQVLFLGRNESRALPASSFPNSYSNSIYYGDLHPSGIRMYYMDKGIFDLKGRKIVLHYPRDNFDDLTFSPPLWLFQN